MDRTYLAIDLKSFYASVECVERGLDPLKTNLVVADASRTEKTICLAVSPSLKKFGIPGRPRLFEVAQRIREINRKREFLAGKKAKQSSFFGDELSANPDCSVDYIIAPPRMARYVDFSTRIYQIYLQYVSSEDIHVYSIDEVFMDITEYLLLYRLSARELAMRMILHVLRDTGITATAGIGSNLYLAKIAMDIEAKHMTPDKNGVRIAALNERSYREKLWKHRPLTDFWRIGPGYAKTLEKNGLYTMGDIARCSIGPEGSRFSEELLYRLFGINAELLIDHAWGWEPVTISDIRAYQPSTNSISSGQVLQKPYTASMARIVVKEMAELLSLELVRKKLVTDQLELTVGYDMENLKDPVRRKAYSGEIKVDHYGRKIPKAAHGIENFSQYTSSTQEMMDAVSEIFDREVDPGLLVRRMVVVANHVLPEQEKPEELRIQLDFFHSAEDMESDKIRKKRERSMQETILMIKKRYGKNAIFRGMNLQEGATARERNRQIGGHKA
ncbi:MAG: DNA methylase [Peptoniphilaceae bacterium]|nr:DNA methylase [Peptoniphilaceae bacterium]